MPEEDTVILATQAVENNDWPDILPSVYPRYYCRRQSTGAGPER